jgi:hypothetical protein
MVPHQNPQARDSRMSLAEKESVELAETGQAKVGSLGSEIKCVRALECLRPPIRPVIVGSV